MCEAGKLTTFVWRLSWKFGDSHSRKPQGLSSHVTGLFYLFVWLNFYKRVTSDNRQEDDVNTCNLTRSELLTTASLRMYVFRYIRLCCWVSFFRIFEEYLPTYSMEQSPPWEPNRFSAIQKITWILWNPKVNCHIHKSKPPSLSWGRSI